MQYFEFDEVQSTQSLAKDYVLNKEASTPFCIMANSQTDGIGRLERSWISPLGNLYASLVFDKTYFASPNHTPYYGALAIHLTLKNLININNKNTDSLFIKWPNDIMLNNCKLCGILTQLIQKNIIIGIGVNITTTPHINEQASGYKATSLMEISNVSIAPMVLVELFALNLESIKDKSFHFLQNEINKVLFKIHQNIEVKTQKNTFCGTNLGIDQEGNLNLKLDDGSVKQINFGDVFFT
jgi:BirA family transcriptional regulator, biotin operon repressor / biotin---[acetyl-CoA-carboxylase] ligase